jgi:hypothetical protein
MTVRRRLARRSSPAGVLLSALLLAAPSAATTSPATSPGTSTDSLTVAVQWAPGQSASWTLTCAPAGGTHPDARRACARLSTIPDAFAALPTGLACTQIWSGPERAHVTGTWQGRPVDREFSRVNGCETARWSEYRPLFTDPGAVTVHGRVDLGPTCPVQRPDENCTTVGAPARVTATGRLGLRHAASGASGFWLHLPRGVWRVSADAGMSCTTVRLDLRHAGPVPEAVIACDTGIRLRTGSTPPWTAAATPHRR